MSSFPLTLFLTVLLLLLATPSSSAAPGGPAAGVDPNAPAVDKILKITKPGAIRFGGPGFGGLPGGMPGGWAKGDVKDKEVIAAATFAADKLYPELHPAPNVRSVNVQVVAGLNYNITMDVTRLTKACKREPSFELLPLTTYLESRNVLQVGASSTTCSVRNVLVWNHFGVLSVMGNSTIPARCGAP